MTALRMIVSNLLLFVYGTLKRGQCNHALIETQPFRGEVSTAPAYRLFDCGPYPALVEAADGGISIVGEVYEITNETRLRLDVLEDAPRLYRLSPVTIPALAETVMTYLYQQDISRFADCGSSWPSPRTTLAS